MPTRVAIVVTKDGTADIASLVRTKNVWIADTPANREAAQAVWSSRQGAEPYEVTTFKVDDEAAPDQWVAMILPVIDDHHPLGADSSSEVALEIHGIGATTPVRAALANFGLFEVVEWPGGFSARAPTRTEGPSIPSERSE